MSKIALIVEANPRSLTESRPSYLPRGRWRVVADCLSKLSVRRCSQDRTVESIYNVGEEFDGECIVIVNVIEASIKDSRYSAFAERA